MQYLQAGSSGELLPTLDPEGQREGAVSRIRRIWGRGLSNNRAVAFWRRKWPTMAAWHGGSRRAQFPKPIFLLPSFLLPVPPVSNGPPTGMAQLHVTGQGSPLTQSIQVSFQKHRSWRKRVGNELGKGCTNGRHPVQSSRYIKFKKQERWKLSLSYASFLLERKRK